MAATIHDAIERIGCEIRSKWLIANLHLTAPKASGEGATSILAAIRSQSALFAQQGRLLATVLSKQADLQQDYMAQQIELARMTEAMKRLSASRGGSYQRQACHYASLPPAFFFVEQ